MKSVKSSGLFKAFAAVLLFVSVVFSALLGVLLIGIYEYGGIYDGGVNLLKAISEDICYSHAYAIGEYYETELRGYGSETGKIAFEAKYNENNTNVRYRVINPEGEVVFSNFNDDEAFVIKTIKYNISSLVMGKKVDKLCTSYDDANDYYHELCETHHIYSFDIAETGNDKLPYKVTVVLGDYNRSEFSVFAAIPSVLQPIDEIHYLFNTVTFVSQYFYVFVGVLCASILFAVLMICFVIASAGHRRKSDEICLGFFARLPLDVYAVIVILTVALLSYFVDESGYVSDYQPIILVAIAVVALILVIGMLFSISARLKVKGWYKNLLVFHILFFVFRILKKITLKVIGVLSRVNLFWKTALYSAFLFVLYVIGAYSGREEGALIVTVVFTLNTIILIKFVLDLRKLESCGKEIASGNIRRKITPDTLLPSLRKHADSLNGISGGLEHALEVSMKSERMRSELITNVSHDIKTPLTSIVNYVGILKKEGLDSDKAVEYLDVLDRQSLRLKKMTEDLVEASKAASGNISVNAEKIDVNIILTQAIGEYKEKLADAGLDSVIKIPECESFVYADGKLLWRIFDNLLGNACKYSMRNTRFYVSLTEREDEIAIIFKNISAEALNISADELTERFVRGDSSRNTEGSGLGLSIAKSLTELQGGIFEIEIDGDLFKSAVKFKKA